VSAGGEWRLSRDVTARVLFPPAELSGRAADDVAMVVQLTALDRWRILLMSDAGENAERFLIESGADLRSDILVKGQHRSLKSGTPEFLDRVQPLAIIASSGSFSHSEHVPDEWADTVTSRGIKLFRQDETGAVRLRFFSRHWEAEPYLGSEIFRNFSR
jgi:competence protein ComEC